jgi:WhiB family redox-sensing transcriptional regulator
MSDEENFWYGAACANPDYDPDWWDVGPDQLKAQAICNDCPIALKCLLYAVQNNEKYLIWGGLLPADRDSLHIRAR